jgi:DNA-binding FadR family transcriptional regulator
MSERDNSDPVQIGELLASENVVLPVRRVRKAYEQVAEQIEQLIFSGMLKRGDRLPTEAELANQCGVSRATVREALRLLAAQRLIRTEKGSGGGSFVTVPSVSSISDYLHSSIGVLTSAHDVSLEEFLEARELFEVPAARRAAERRDPVSLRHIHDSIPELSNDLDTEEQFKYNKGFHSAIVEAAGNTLIQIAAQPVFSVLQTNLSRGVLGEEFHRSINEHHVEISAAIDLGDGAAAEQLMRDHLEFLRPHYERVWPHAKTRVW